MTWTDDAKKKFEEAMEQFKGQRFKCMFCEMEGEYDKDLKPCLTNIGRFGVVEGDVYKASVETTFMCKDTDACKQRMKDKGD